MVSNYIWVCQKSVHFVTEAVKVSWLCEYGIISYLLFNTLLLWNADIPIFET